MSPQKPLRDSMLELMVALDFDEADLKANRDHYITKKQRSRLNGKRQHWRDARWLALRSMLPLIVMVVFAPIFQKQPFFSVLVLGLTLLALVIGDNYRHEKYWELNKDLDKGDVLAVEGVPFVYKERTRRGVHYTCQIARRRFEISGAAYAALAGVGECRAYLSPWSKTLLSMEILDSSSEQMPKIKYWKRQPPFNIMKWPEL